MKDVETARQQLALVLGFFTRADDKLSLLLGVDLGMTAVAFAALDVPAGLAIGQVMLAVTFAALMLISLLHLFKGSFPQLEGGEQSLVYFRAIAAKQEAAFVAEFSEMTEADLARDLLQQTWRNSAILKKKFGHVKTAYVVTIVAVMPWSGLLAWRKFA